MNKLIPLILCCVSLTTWGAEPVSAGAAVPLSADVPSEEERNAERERLTLARDALEAQYRQDNARCYQNFDVNSCRLKVRDRRIDADAALRKEELRFNAQERQIQAENTRRSLAERNSEAEQKKAEADRAAAVAAAKERADANAQKQIDHALQGTKRGDYEQKLRDAAQHREDVAKKLRERKGEPAAPLPVPNR